MKKLLFFALAMLLILNSGCTLLSKKEGPDKPPTDQRSPQQDENQKEDPADYIVGLDAPITGLEKWVEKYSPYEGVFLQDKGDYRSVLVSMGEKLTGGYRLKVEDVSKTADKWVIKVSYLEPKEGEIATQVISYPNEVVSVINDGREIEVYEVSANEKLDLITIPKGTDLPISKSFIVTSPLPGEEISSPVTIIGKARVFEAVFTVHIEDGHNYLVEKTVMAEEGAPEWGKFEVSLPFDNPTSPSGTIVFAVENMENGKLIEELQLPVKFK